MDTKLFDYNLSEDLIAQVPLKDRDQSRLMVVNRSSGTVSHLIFRDIVNVLCPGDCLVLNTTKVFPGRIFGKKRKTGGKVEVLLLEKVGESRWLALTGGARLRTGSEIEFPGTKLEAKVEERPSPGRAVLSFRTSNGDLASDDMLFAAGDIPLPPYIKFPLSDPDRYQTVYSVREISAAAPTAGLHFTEALLSKIREKGVNIAKLELAVGADTFSPVRTERIEDHKMHSEWFKIDANCASLVNSCKGRVIAVGTTVVRALETAALHAKMTPGAYSGEGFRIVPCEGRTDLFIKPGHEFLATDAIVTNFHFPRSTLLMLVCAFGGIELIMNAYRIAMEKRYRFFSFGDSMFIF